MHAPDALTFEDRDEYHRRGVAERLITLLDSDVPVSPVVINGRWGDGKTEFCHKTINLMRRTGHPARPVYVDAYREDHADEPLATLLGAVLRLMTPGDRRTSLIEKAIPVVRFATKAALRIGAAWLLRQGTDTLAAEWRDVAKAVGDQAIDASVEALLSDHEQADANLEALRSVLAEVAAESPVVIFLDELDRCRPDFAVAMLERIKHVFDVPNVQFVLLANGPQLEEVIAHTYGGDQVTARRYLDKFIGYQFALPRMFMQANREQVPTACLHFVGLCQSSPRLPDALFCHGPAGRFAQELIQAWRLSLREVETFVRLLEVMAVLDEEVWPENLLPGYGLLRVLGAYLVGFDSGAAEDLLDGRIDTERLWPALGLQVGQMASEWRPISFSPLVYVMLSNEAARLQAKREPDESDAKHRRESNVDSADREAWQQRIDVLFRGVYTPDSYVAIVTTAIRLLKLEAPA